MNVILCARLSELGGTLLQLVTIGDVNFERLKVYQLRRGDQTDSATKGSRA